jgi:hypothetical protein
MEPRLLAAGLRRLGLDTDKRKLNGGRYSENPIITFIGEPML